MIRSAVLAVVAAVSACAADLASWTASAPVKADGIVLKRTPGCRWRIENDGGVSISRLQPADDYYTQAEYVFSVERPITGAAWLVIEFLDRGYGLTSVTPRVPEAEQWGIARVNTGRLRRAVLHYRAGALKDGICIANLDYLHSVRLTEDRPMIEQAPLVDPAVRFERPSQRVMPAGGDYLTPEQLPEMLAGLRNSLPLVRALGFNGIESFVRWGFAERRRGVYDWSFYDAIAAEIEKHGLKWFPMLLAGSGYALPDWMYRSKDDFGFVCLEHGLRNDTQSIFHPFQAEYAGRFIREFGKHYGGRSVLLGIRLGPSGDYGEAQYPARGPGFRFTK
ncbi:MAG: beta-galactosidase, partial [Bryobacteraceae bacterium]